MDKKRRNVLVSLAMAPLALQPVNKINTSIKHSSNSHVKCSVNAYSFNDILKSGEMTFYDMMEFASSLGLDAVDLTGYYFTNYPEVPDDQVLFELKKKALQLGLNITWTGVRNNFVNPNKTSRVADKRLIENWLQVSSKLGATIMRIFAGKGKHSGFTRDEVKQWMVGDFKVCAKHGERSGVIVGMQHHNDFLYEPEEIIDILKRVHSEWFGLVLDIGSLRRGNPYKAIKKLAPYANYWFIKELVYVEGIAEPVNMQKIAEILKDTNYTGYISFESLTDGDPKEIVTSMYHDFKSAYSKL